MALKMHRVQQNAPYESSLRHSSGTHRVVAKDDGTAFSNIPSESPSSVTPGVMNGSSIPPEKSETSGKSQINVGHVLNGDSMY